MDTSLDVFVPLEVDKALSPNTRVHWSRKHAATQDARAAAKYATINAMYMSGVILPKDYGVSIEAVIHWPKGRKRMDDDNAVSVLKSYIDGVADALEINDSLFVLGPVSQVTKAPVAGVVFVLTSLCGS